MATMTVAAYVLNRVRQDYLEMPGLSLTAPQASRLWNLDAGECQALLSTLVHEMFLARTDAGRYLLRGDNR